MYICIQLFLTSHCWVRAFLQYEGDQAIVHHAGQVRVGGLHMSSENLLGSLRYADAEPPAMGELIDWVPSTPAAAQSLYGRALEAGREGWDGSPLWIIRAHHKGDLVPGKLAIKHRAAFIPFSRRELPVHNFEVLCAPSNMVQWVSASSGEVPPNAIIAGNTHTAESLYIGRVYHKRSITPGKIHPSHGCCYVSYGGIEVQYKQYEVLLRLDSW